MARADASRNWRDDMKCKLQEGSSDGPLVMPPESSKYTRKTKAMLPKHVRISNQTAAPVLKKVSTPWRQEPLYVSTVSTAEGELLCLATKHSFPADIPNKMKLGSCETKVCEAKLEEDDAQKRLRGPIRFAEVLLKLHDMPASRVIRATGLLKFGPNHLELLTQHLSAYGPVDKVLPVMCSPPDSQEDQPAGIAFVIMESSQDASRALANRQHSMQGGLLKLRPFYHKA